MSAGIVNKLLIFFEHLRCMENSARHVRRRAEQNINYSMYLFDGDGNLVDLLLAAERRQYIVYFFPDVERGRGVVFQEKIFLFFIFCYGLDKSPTKSYFNFRLRYPTKSYFTIKRPRFIFRENIKRVPYLLTCELLPR